MLLTLRFIVRRKCNFNKFSIKGRNLIAPLSMAQKNVCSFSHLIAVAQMRSTSNKDENFANSKRLVEKAASRGAQMTFLPEGCDYIGDTKQQSIEMAETEKGNTLTKYCQLAESLQMWLSIGGIHIREENSDKINNTHFIIDNLGNVVEKYVKTHLFNVEIPERNIRLQESTYAHEGERIPNPVLTPCGLVSLGICYDLRFPEFSLLQRKKGAQVLTFPSAFTTHTGLAHWHPLLRARAIETQCYVIAAAQSGQHNSKRSSFGHALVVDPWGTVVAEVSEGTNVAFAEIDLEYLEDVRKQMPVLKHRRNDLYSLHTVSDSSEPCLMELMPFPADYVIYPFGQVTLKGSSIFLRTSLSHAFVNRKPFCPGHVLVSPQKPIKRFEEMNAREVGDFSQAIVMALCVLIDKYSPFYTQVAIQDGKWSGQTIHHVHGHVIPFLEEGHSLLEAHESKDSKDWRNDDDMATEASDLRQHTTAVVQKSSLLSSNIPRPLRFHDPHSRGTFQMNELTIMTEDVLAFTGNCFAFLPSNPILPGHVCVCPVDEASCLSELPPGAVADMFLLLQRIQKKIEEYYKVSSSTIFIKGFSSTKGLCAHILPRRESDLPSNDDIYVLLFKHQVEAPTDADSQKSLLSHFKQSFR